MKLKNQEKKENGKYVQIIQVANKLLRRAAVTLFGYIETTELYQHLLL